MTKVLFCRHGESEHNKKELIQGQIDSELTEKGREQAEELAETLSGTEFDAIFSSGLKRARDTADIINQDHGVEIFETEKLRERDLGDLEGEHYTKWNDVETDDHHSWRPENGESLKEHKQRVAEVLDTILEKDLENVLVVAHGGSIRAALMDILGCESRQAWRIKLDNCSITRLDHNEGRWMIREVNGTSHLED